MIWVVVACGAIAAAALAVPWLRARAARRAAAVDRMGTFYGLQRIPGERTSAYRRRILERAIEPLRRRR